MGMNNLENMQTQFMYVPLSQIYGYSSLCLLWTKSKDKEDLYMTIPITLNDKIVNPNNIDCPSTLLLTLVELLLELNLPNRRVSLSPSPKSAAILIYR